jgi:hypothetical protein
MESVTPIETVNGIQYFELTMKHKNEAHKLLIDQFTDHEPINGLLKIPREGVDSFFNLLDDKFIYGNGISVCAVDEATGKLVGLFTAMDAYGIECSDFKEIMALMKKYDKHTKKYPGHAIFTHIVEEVKNPLRKEAT